MILAGDIGGTKTVLALYRGATGKLESAGQEVYKSREFPQFEQILTRFLNENQQKKGREKIEKMCLGVAGPIKDGRCKTTNLPWLLDEKALTEDFGIQKVKLLNDLEAAAYGMLFLSDREMVLLNQGARPETQGNIAVIAAGTGLGEAFLCWDGQAYLTVPSEGGHTDFAPQTDREIALLRFLRAEFAHVSYERLLSGPGLFNIYRFLRDTGDTPEPAWLKEKLQGGDPGAVITEVGLKQGHALCTEALHLFTSIYGAEAGNLALKALSLGGVYIGGGIAPKILEKLRDGTFMDGFLNKGRYTEILREIPVKVCLNNQAPLIGAAHYALRI